ncbi:ABC transporter permease subunit [Paenibacillus sp. HJL G12]|uniref:ABC transporter permease subunit n=1 Tax=Paenibacillus dendrobii TaxID=2691084 RepID=A0A7X3IFS7_9BACL|nr:carbohydrate ABC transporter permease [Paenibacillus dendrobii]MWV42763.1 ABC transporter permease subunit [Paenibacillus dendrobii]
MKTGYGYRVFQVINYFFLALCGLVTLVPFLYVILVSFTDATEYMTSPIVIIPKHWSLASYEYIFSTSTFMRSMGVSAFLAIVGTACSLIVTSALAYAISRKRLKGRKFFQVSILITMLFSAGMIPNFLLIDSLGLMNSIWSLIIPSLTSAWYVLLMKNFFSEIPDELEEAARIDGCTDIGVFIKVILPVSTSALAAFGLFYAVGYWNTYFNAILYINNDALRPMQVVLQLMLITSSTQMADPSVAAMLESEANIPPQVIKMAAVVVSSLPIVMVYPFLQKYFIKGMMVGSVKG